MGFAGSFLSGIEPRMSAATLAGRLAEAEAATRRQPGHPLHWLQLGLTLNAAGQANQALEAFARAAALDPGFAEAQYNCGVILYHQGQLREAVDRYQAALASQPNFVLARSNLGVALEAMGDTEAALGAYNEAIASDPNNPSPYWNKALLLLRNGDYEEGWRFYEWRWSAGKIGPRRTFPGKRPWLGGTPLHGKTILLHAEQGLGDMIQFARFIPLVKALGARVVLESFTPLTALFESVAGADLVVSVGDDLPKFDLYCPLMSLPRALGITRETIPWPGAYLSAPPARVAVWKERLGLAQRARVGFVWKGNPRHEGDSARSIPLELLKSLFGTNADFVSLQKNATDTERALLDDNGVTHIGHMLTDFTDSAAVLETCDQIISVDTSLAHLAGAMAKPVWVLLPERADWRWLKDDEASPWYPTARLFRGGRQGLWQDVMARAARAMDSC